MPIWQKSADLADAEINIGTSLDLNPNPNTTFMRFYFTVNNKTTIN